MGADTNSQQNLKNTVHNYKGLFEIYACIKYKGDAL